VIYDDDSYGKKLTAEFKKEAAALGLTVAVATSYLRERTTTFAPLATSLIEKKPDVVFIAGLYNEGALICRALREAGGKMPIIGADGLLSPTFRKVAGAAAEGVLVTTPYHLDADQSPAFAKEFIDAYEDVYGRAPDVWAAFTHDAVLLAGRVIRKHGGDRAKIRAALTAMRTKDSAFEGVTGRTYFDAEGNSLRSALFVRVRKGVFEIAPRQLD
jgi:branched-chain amino acid transport system substrate-binding protein